MKEEFLCPMRKTVPLRAFRGAKCRNSQDISVEWIDGRHGSSQRPLPSLDEVPVPDILNRLPYLHEQRPRGSTAMIEAASLTTLSYFGVA